jgi:CSLREA domain-containing protein
MARRRFVALQGARPVAAKRSPHAGISLSELARCIDIALLRCAGAAVLTTAAGIGLSAAPGLAVAETFLVTTLADTDDGACDADCSLREAIAAANAAGTDDVVDATGVTGTIVLGGTEIPISGTSDLTITGPGADRLGIDADSLSRVFHSTATGRLAIEGVTLAHGNTSTNGGALYAYQAPLTLDGVSIVGSYSGSDGGGFYVFGADATIVRSSIHDNVAGRYEGGFYVGGNLDLVDSIVTGNTAADFAGGLVADGDIVLRRSTISGNRAGLDPQASFGSAGGVMSYSGITSYNSTISNNAAATYAGGLWAYDGISLHHTTVTGNTAADGIGGGLYADAADDPLVLHDSIVAGNSAGGGDPDIGGGTVTSGYSLIGVEPANFTDSGGSLVGSLVSPLDAELGPLADNGGPTLTHDLLPGSPALDSGDPAFAPPPEFDQRGAPYLRVYNARLDMGAVEYQPGDVIFANGFELPPPQTATFTSDNLPLDLSAPGTYEATIPVSATGTVAKVEVTFRFDVPFIGPNQLQPILVAPNGDSIELFPHGTCGGGTARMLGPYTFKDDPVPDQAWPGYPCPAPGIITLGQFRPHDPALSFAEIFDGDSVEGTWRLQLDVSPAGSPGTSLVQADLRLGYYVQE